MKFGSIHTNITLDAFTNPNGWSNTMDVRYGVNARQSSIVPGASCAIAPVDAFSNQCRAAQRVLGAYLKLCSSITIDHKGVLEGRAYFQKQLMGLAELHRPPTLRPHPEVGEDPFLSKFLLELGYRFFDELSECIHHINETWPWLSNSVGTVFLNPVLVSHIKQHQSKLQTLDAMIAPFRTDTQEKSQPPIVSNKRARVLRQILVDSGTQTRLKEQSCAQTQTASPQQKDKQTDSPQKILVTSCSVQTMDVALPEQSVQTEITSQLFSVDAATQTKQFEDKAVGADGLMIDSSTQTENAINIGWVALHTMIEETAEVIMAYASRQSVGACWPEPHAVPQDLDMQSSIVFDAFDNRCGQIKSANDKAELMRTVGSYFLPCMEQARTARTKVAASLTVKRFTDQEQDMRAVIKELIGVLDKTLMIGMKCLQWAQNFPWEESEESKDLLKRLGDFSLGDKALVCAAGEPLALKNPVSSFDLNSIGSAVDEIASILP